MENELMERQEMEEQLDREVTSIEARASSIIIRDQSDYSLAGNFLKEVKSLEKKAEDYWEPLRASSYNAYKSVTGHKKSMIDPLKKAEAILKNKMSAFLTQQERKQREEQEKLRKLARQEMEKKLEEAAEAEASGDHFGAEYAMAEAEVMDGIAQSATVAVSTSKTKGVSQTKDWKIKSIDNSKVPDEIAGVIIRPVDDKEILRLIRATKGKIQIPGVEYEETVKISIRAS